MLRNRGRRPVDQEHGKEPSCSETGAGTKFLRNRDRSQLLRKEPSCTGTMAWAKLSRNSGWNRDWNRKREWNQIKEEEGQEPSCLGTGRGVLKAVDQLQSQ
jgi:hypothetical protein